jgi:hypothetical protein
MEIVHDMTTEMTRQDAIAQLTAPGQVYEFEQLDLYGRPCRAFRNAPPTLHDLFQQNRSDATFYVYADERYSYAEVYQRACALASHLQERYAVDKGIALPSPCVTFLNGSSHSMPSPRSARSQSV